MVRGRTQSLHIYGTRGGDPIVVSSGDGGWIHLGPHVAELLAGCGYYVVGLDSRVYLTSFTNGDKTLRPEEVIADYDSLIQVKLLRVLQENEVRPVGTARTVNVDARVVAATNVDLERAVAEQRFRHDLYYRLSVVVIRLPSLRERRGDIPLLVQQFLRASSARCRRTVSMTEGAIEALTRYDWPGNVRELENTIERLVVFSRGDIDVDDLPPAVTAARPFEQTVFEGLPTLDELERRYLIHVLEAVGGNRTRAAEALGIDRRTLYRMAERFGIAISDEQK